eukprot:5696322-Amphidinium_carterae.1
MCIRDRSWDDWGFEGCLGLSLKEDAMWLDCLKCMFADECNHRDVNHTFASMNANDPNPFVEKHKKDLAFD